MKEIQMNNSAFSIAVGKKLAEHNNPNYSEENYTHVIPSYRNFTVQSKRNPEPKATIMARAAYFRAIHQQLNDR
jgi:hypothetical protein